MSYDPKRAIKAQILYCHREKVPMYAPPDGRCPRCGMQIYRELKTSYGYSLGITIERAESGLITGCPFCNYSFVE